MFQDQANYDMDVRRKRLRALGLPDSAWPQDEPLDPGLFLQNVSPKVDQPQMLELPPFPLKANRMEDLANPDSAYDQPAAGPTPKRYDPNSLDYPPAQGGIEDSPLKSYHFSLIDEIANQASGRKEIEDRIARAVGGENVQTQIENDDRNRKNAMVGNVVAQTAHLDDTQFSQYMKALQQELNHSPVIPQQVRPAMPNAWQSGLAFLASMFDKRHAFDIAATPFLANTQAADQDNARNLQIYDLQSKEHARKLGLLQDAAQMQSQRDITQANLNEGGLDRQAQMRGQDMTLSRAMWTDLNASDSVPRLKASIAAIEGSGVPLPENWKEIKSDLLNEATQRQNEKDQAKKDAKSEELIQKYIAKASDPMAPPQARLMNAHIASMMMKDGDPRHGYLEQIMPGLSEFSVQQKKAQAEIDRIQTRNSLDKQMTDARIQEIGTRRALMRTQIGLNDKRADKLSKELDWMDAEKAMNIAKGYAAVDNLNSQINTRGAKLTQQGLAASNSTISSGLRTLSAQMNTLRNERARLEAIQQNYDPNDDEFKSITSKIGAIDGTIGTLKGQYDELAGEAQKLRTKLQTLPGGGAEGGSPKALSGFLKDWAGTPYVWGGNSKKGIDCSAFACRLLNDVYGVKASGNTTVLLKQGQEVDAEDQSDLQEGDLLFFKNPNGSRHVITYLGNGLTAEASTSKGVVTRPLTAKRFASATNVRRLR